MLRALRVLTGLTLLAAVVAAAAATTTDCPQYCECKWKGGKESAICRAANFKALPRGLDAGTQLLDLTGNAITALAREAFASAGLVNLQKVYLARCRLAAVDRLAFRLLINLVELDLSHNELQAVPSAALESVPELRELRLSGNPIARLDAKAFFKVPELVRLEMSDCRIASIDIRAFAGLEKKLEWLKLDHNRLSNVRPDAFSAMESLHGLELDGNPWNCTCSLRPFRSWMVRRNVPWGVPPVCTTPGRLRGRAWDRLDLDDFACGPRVEALRGAAQAVEGDNVTLSCRVQGAPSPNVRWLFRNRVVANASAPPPGSGGVFASTAHGHAAFGARKLLYVRTVGNSSNLTIVATDPQDAGVYVCVADNRAGRVDASVTLSVSRRTAAAEGSGGPGGAVALSGKVVAASVLVALLFVTTTCLVALCLWSLRKRHSLWVEQARGGARLARLRHDDANHYEKIEMMNHKPSPQPEPQRVVVASTAIGGARTPDGECPQLGPAHRRGGARKQGRYRGVPTCEDDEVGYDAEVEVTPSASHAGGVWTSDDTISRHSDSRGGAGAAAGASHEPPPPPRVPGALSSDGELLQQAKQQQPALAAPLRNGSAGGAGGAAALSHHVLRNQVLGDSGGSLYTSLLADDDLLGVDDRSYPDLLQPQTDSLPPSSLGGGELGGGGGGGGARLWGTLPRRPHHQRGDRLSRRGSESPLLADSRYGSSGGSTSSGLGGAGLGATAAPYSLYHQRSSSSLNLAGASPLAPLPLAPARAAPAAPRRNPSLPGSPSRDHRAGAGLGLVETPILAALSGAPNKRQVLLHCRFFFFSREKGKETCLERSGTLCGYSSVSPSSYDYHTAQLERFLEEYRTLHSELSRMKETCDSLAANPKSILKKKQQQHAAGGGGGAGAGAGAGGPPQAHAALSPEHPYWVPRSELATLARRYSGGDFFPS
ncbi:Leucine-rich repeat-containing protein 4C [Frankliniella fusca]|uniref:Leucine-rich repeat-containing protein 4C n=1 Tax=Frankliniella fusca TaxID=407009 RepID=A0AAE1HZZ1_9NEOP|nr:Leucine-rich repeat-containing protein 4C [Frankliniella fusca]